MTGAINGALLVLVIGALVAFIAARESPEALLRISVWARARCEAQLALKRFMKEQDSQQRREMGMERKEAASDG